MQVSLATAATASVVGFFWLLLLLLFLLLWLLLLYGYLLQMLPLDPLLGYLPKPRNLIRWRRMRKPSIQHHLLPASASAVAVFGAANGEHGSVRASNTEGLLCEVYPQVCASDSQWQCHRENHFICPLSLIIAIASSAISHQRLHLCSPNPRC